MIWDTLIAKAMTNRMVYAQFKDTVTPEMFQDRMLTSLWELLGEFYEEQGRSPTGAEMLMFLRRLPPHQKERLKDYIAKVEHWYKEQPDVSDDVLATEVLDGIRKHMTENLILSGSAMLDSGRVNYEELEAQMKKILSTTVDLDLGIEVSRNPDAAMKLIANGDRFVPIPTGIEAFDRTLNGGWYKRQFACGIGASGVGKSVVLVNQACGAAYAGFNTLLLTVELEDVAVVERVLCRIAQRPREKLIEEYELAEQVGNRSESMTWVSKWFGRSNSRLIIKQARMGRFGVSDLEAYLDRMELLASFVPDLIVIDYLDELRPSADQRRQEKRHQHRGIAQDLVGLAKSRNVAVSTMTQTNREALEKKRVTLKHIGEDYGKVQVSDLVYALCQTQEEYDRQEMRIRWLKKRDRGGRGQEIPCRVDYPIMLVDSLEKLTVVAG